MKMTKVELEYLNKFDRTYHKFTKQKRSTREDSYRCTQIVFDEETIHSVIDKPSDFAYDHLPKGILDVMKTSERKFTIYSTGDYYAKPQLFYKHNWTNMIHDEIDKERGRKEEDETGIPGIVFKDGQYTVSSFHKNTLTILGHFNTLDYAKGVLLAHNKKLGRGWGVDYV